MSEPGKGDGEPRPGGASREPSDADVEAAWAEITQRLGPLESADPFEPGNAAPEGVDNRSPDPDGAPTPAPDGPRDYAVEDDDEGFVPPEPGRIDASDPLTTLSWVAAVGGPLLTVVLLVTWTSAPTWVFVVALGASLAGWLTLMWRLPKDRDDSGDDGAVV